jgi:hypothetical protein
VNDYQKLLNACKEYRAKLDALEAENAALRVALEDIMTESDEQHIWRMARAALQKEAHP